MTPAAGRRAAAAPAGRRRGALAWTAGTAAAGAALFACYLGQSRTVSVGSDGASQALQAWDLLHGNLLLHGWWVTDVSFYTTELPQYALIELARGLTADVIHVAGAMTYTLVVLAAVLLAKGRTAAPGPGGEGAVSNREALTRALVTAGIMLAPQPGAGTQTLVLSPDHVGTTVPVLLVFLLVDRAGGLDGPDGGRRAGRRARWARWGVPVATWLALSWTALADAMTIFVAVIPLALVCALRLGHALAVRREPLAASRRAAALLAAAVLAVPAELGAAALIRADGGWRVNGLRTALAGAGQLPGNARLAGEGLLELFGADVPGAPGGAATALAAVHLAGVALAAAGVLLAARGFPRSVTRGTAFAGTAFIESVLLVGIVIDVGAYLAGVQAVNILSTREIAPVLPFAAVLAGRRLGPWLAPGPRDGRAASRPGATGARRAARPATARALRYGLSAVLAVYAAGLCHAATRPPAAPQGASLAAWLRARHLTAGLSGYHQANIVTLETGGAVTLRPVTRGGHGRLAAYTWNASTAWYDPASQRASFLVLTAPGAPGDSGLTAAQAAATFGPPARTYRYRGYVILAWPGTVNLLAGLRSRRPAAG